MYCAKCGGTIDDDATFCSVCGTQRHRAVQQPGQVIPQQPGQFMLPQTDGRAIASLVLGILGLFFSIFAAIPAIILGHISYSEIKKSAGRLTGDGLAIGGLVLGYLGTALLPIILAIAIPNLMHSKMVANEAGAAATVRTLIASEFLYSDKFPEAGFAPDLETLGPGGSACASGEGTEKHACLIDGGLGCSAGTSGNWCTKDNYKYNIIGIKPTRPKASSDFVITATPRSSKDGRKSFCATGADGVVRSHEGSPLAAPITSVEECQKWEAL
ncbi:MAG TPA: DUF4190 domain-containing protein [Candidatus Angelobacter sp.]